MNVREFGWSPARIRGVHTYAALLPPEYQHLVDDGQHVSDDVEANGRTQQREFPVVWRRKKIVAVDQRLKDEKYV